jgi:hypothetical protein
LRARSKFAFQGFLATLLAATLLPRWALADETQIARAEALFIQGKQRLAEQDYTRACPLLAASYELDAGTGVLLALAICHEGEAKFASAVAEYTLVAERSAREGRSDRERVARDRALALASQVSTLTVVAPVEARASRGFVVRRGDVELARSEWNVPVPLDGGEYIIEASEPGKNTWRTHVQLAPSGERRRVVIPPLQAIAKAAAASPSATRARTEERAARREPQREKRKLNRGSDRLTPLQLVGVAAVGAGVAGIGVGTVYALRALDKYEDSNRNGCVHDVCEGQGKADRLAARSAGNMATVGFLLGGAVALGGTLSFLLAARPEEPARSTDGPRGAVSVRSRDVMLAFGTSF